MKRDFANIHFKRKGWNCGRTEVALDERDHPHGNGFSKKIVLILILLNVLKSTFSLYILIRLESLIQQWFAFFREDKRKVLLSHGPGGSMKYRQR